jgi:hypothetical protein
MAESGLVGENGPSAAFERERQVSGRDTTGDVGLVKGYRMGAMPYLAEAE